MALFFKEWLVDLTYIYRHILSYFLGILKFGRGTCLAGMKQKREGYYNIVNTESVYLILFIILLFKKGICELLNKQI